MTLCMTVAEAEHKRIPNSLETSRPIRMRVGVTKALVVNFAAKDFLILQNENKYLLVSFWHIFIFGWAAVTSVKDARIQWVTDDK